LRDAEQIAPAAATRSPKITFSFRQDRADRAARQRLV